MSTLAINSVQPRTFQRPGTTASLRIWFQFNFVTAEGLVILGGPARSSSMYINIPCTLDPVTHILTIPSFSLPTTNDSSIRNVRASGLLFDSSGAFTNDYLFKNWIIPEQLAPSCNFAELEAYNSATNTPPGPTYPTTDQVEVLINNALGTLNDASSIEKGRTYLDVDPVDPLIPRAVGTNSPLIAAFTVHASRYASFNLAVAAINSLGGGTVIVDSASPVTATIIVPSTIQVVFQGQGMLTGTSKTVNFVGPMFGPPRRLFASGITVTFTNSLTKGVIYPQWWGVSTDAVDNIIPLTACIAAAKTGARSIHFLDGTYYISDTATIGGFQGYYLSGENKLTTQIVITTANKRGVFINHGSYGVIERLGFSTTALSTNATSILDIDADGSISALKTQQISLRDIMVHGAGLAASGLHISRSSSAQGDTILISNPLILSCTQEGLGVLGFNALSIQIENGDIQGCPMYGVRNIAGSVFLDGTSFQNQSFGALSLDGIVISQITLGGSDYSQEGGTASSRSSMSDIRSESDVLATGGGIGINGASINGGSQQQWFADSYYNLGQLIHGTPGVGEKGVDGRTFMLVDFGATSTPFADVGTLSTNAALSDPAASYGVNDLVGQAAVVRYPNGFFETRLVASNTATTITPVTPFTFIPTPPPIQVCGYAQVFDCIEYRIAGLTGSTEPTWSDAAKGYFNPFDGNVSEGWIGVAGSNVITGGYYNFGISGASVGDYILMFGAGTDGGPFIAKITNFSRSGSTATATLDRDVITATPLGAGGYVGTPFGDGDVFWIDIDFNCAASVGTSVALVSNGGKIGVATSLTDSVFSRPDFLENGYHTSSDPINKVRALRNTGYTPGSYNLGPFTQLPDFSSAPNVEQLLASIPLVDMNSAIATALYAAPDGHPLVVTKIVVRDASTSLTTASYSFGWNSVSFNDVIADATHTELTGSTLLTELLPKIGSKVGAHPNVLSVLCNTLQGGAATTTIDVYGYYTA